MRLSILDQSIAAAGRSPAEAIRDSVALARHAEDLGYHRFWVSEHHGFPGLAGSAPMPLLGAIAARTRRIRIGAAAVILPHTAPLKVAEEALVLEALAPGRVDLGLGRGPGASRATAYALSPELVDNPLAGAFGSPFADRFAEDVATLAALLGGEPLPADHTFAGVAAVPAPEGEGPVPFLVGGTPYTARLAGRLGLPYAFAHFVAGGAGGAETVAIYRDAFVPGRFLDRPRLAVSAFALAAASAAEAAAVAGAFARWRTARDAGRFSPIEPPAPAAASRADALRRDGDPAADLFGTADVVVAGLRDLADRYRADELVLQAPAFELGARMRSLRLIAEAAGLRAGGAQAGRPDPHASHPLTSGPPGAAPSPFPSPRLMEPSR